MNEFEHHIRKKLRRHSTPMDTDALWESIQQDLPSSGDKRKKRRALWLWWLLSGCLGMGVMLWMGIPPKNVLVESNLPQNPLDWDTPSLYYPLLHGQQTTIYTAAPAPSVTPHTTASRGVFDDGTNDANDSPTPVTLAKTSPVPALGESSQPATQPSAEVRLPQPEWACLNRATPFVEHLPSWELDKKPRPPETAGTEDDSLAHRKTQFSLGLTHSLAYTHSSIQSKEVSMGYYAEKRNDTEEHQYTFSLGLSWTATFKNQLRFRTGLEYTQVRQEFSYMANGRSNSSPASSASALERAHTNLYTIESQPKATPNSHTQHLPSSSKEVRRHPHTYHILDVPLVIGYEHRLKHAVVVLEGGLYYNLRTFTQGYIIQPDGQYSGTSGQNLGVFRKRHGFSTYTGLSLQLPLSKRMQLSMGSHVRYTPFSITTREHPTRQRLMSFGVHTGLYFQL